MTKLPSIDAVADRYKVSVTPLMDSLAKAEPAGAVALQFRPDVRELISEDEDLADPIGDSPHSPVPGVVHRYPDRALLMPTTVCPVYCRFCFRREVVGQESAGLLSDDELNDALAYLRDHEEIWEVILSGGDPLALSPRRLGDILERLRAIPHIRVIRVHTRVPLVLPSQVDKLIDVLKAASPVFVVLHTNHADEFTPEGEAACARLVDSGIPMLSQTVLLKGINDDADTLEALMRRCVENRIKPYYLHHTDKAPGTSHLRVTLDTGREITGDLRGRVSGICQPTYVLDIPGGHGKVPVGPEYLELLDADHWWVRDHHGVSHRYRD